jgi:hypothetical protein
VSMRQVKEMMNIVRRKFRVYEKQLEDAKKNPFVSISGSHRHLSDQSRLSLMDGDAPIPITIMKYEEDKNHPLEKTEKPKEKQDANLPVNSALASLLASYKTTKPTETNTAPATSNPPAAQPNTTSSGPQVTFAPNVVDTTKEETVPQDSNFNEEDFELFKQIDGATIYQALVDNKSNPFIGHLTMVSHYER